MCTNTRKDEKWWFQHGQRNFLTDRAWLPLAANRHRVSIPRQMKEFLEYVYWSLGCQHVLGYSSGQYHSLEQ